MKIVFKYISIFLVCFTLSDAIANADFQTAWEAYIAGDYETAYRKLKPLAEQGDIDAQYTLGIMHDKGRGVPEDDVEAVKWYRLAAEQGDVDSQYNLGVKYSNGDGVPEDNVEAVKWYRLAAEQGDIDAQYMLGDMYLGDGVPENNVEAVKWYRLAAEQGMDIAQFNLGFMYYRGKGVPEDLVLAYMWWNLAASQGFGDGIRNKKIVEQEMTREQIAEAQKLSREWVENHQ